VAVFPPIGAWRCQQVGSCADGMAVSGGHRRVATSGKAPLWLPQGGPRDAWLRRGPGGVLAPPFVRQPGQRALRSRCSEPRGAAPPPPGKGRSAWRCLSGARCCGGMRPGQRRADVSGECPALPMQTAASYPGHSCLRSALGPACSIGSKGCWPAWAFA
jgi:hypothetical protein